MSFPKNTVSQPIITNPLKDQVIPSNTNVFTVPLNGGFDDPSTTGLTLRMKLYNNFANGATINVVLYDESAPVTVANFLSYVDNDSYTDTFIHRSVDNADGTPFIIQGGSFTVTPRAVNPFVNILDVIAQAPVANEFSPDRSSILGTIAMAKSPGNPNSATSGWFFNMTDNSSNLDNQNGGFSVFGQIQSNADLDIINDIEVVPTLNAGGSFTDLPLLTNTLDGVTVNDFIRFENFSTFTQRELSFEIISNSNPNLANITLNNNGSLSIDGNNSTGATEVTVRATNLFGQSVEDSLIINLVASEKTTPFYRFQNSTQPGTYLFAGATERESVLANNTNFAEEGFAFTLGTQPGDSLIAFNRFRNVALPGTYLYAGEVESISIRANFSDQFVDEGTAFYAYGVGEGAGTEIYRFENKQLANTYIYVGQEEKNAILNNANSNFTFQGVAFEVFS